MAGPGWLPRGAIPDPYVWSYDLKRGRWISPEDKAPDDGQLVAMPEGFDPRGRGQGLHVVLSPPGVAAPPGAMAYSPATKSLHGPGEVPPLDLENLSVILAPRPGPPRPPMPPPQEVPSPMAGAPGWMGPVGPGAGNPMPPTTQPMGTPPPPTGGMGPPQAAQPPPGLQPMATPDQPMAAPGVGKPPSLYSQRAHQILQSLLGTPTPDAGPGVGQDVGVGADNDLNELQTQALQSATRRHVGTPYVWAGNDLTKGVDCSGFVNEILRGFGARITGRPNTGTYRTQLAAPVGWDDIRPGDILLSAANPRNPQEGEHMALYVGGGQMAESRGGRGVMIGSVQGTSLTPYRMREPVPGLQDATRLAQNAAGAASSPQRQGGGPRLGAGGVENAPDAPLVGVSRDQFAANAMIHANAAAQIIQDTYGISLPPEVLAGYAASETGYGGNNLARNYGNFFSIYARNPWTGASRPFSGDGQPAGTVAATYNSPTESFVHFGQQLANNERYRPALNQYQQDGNAGELLHNMNRAGWAVDQDWWSKVMNATNSVRGVADRAGVQAGSPSTGNMQLLSNSALDPSSLPDWLRAAVDGFVDRVSGATPAYAGDAIPEAQLGIPQQTQQAQSPPAMVYANGRSAPGSNPAGLLNQPIGTGPRANVPVRDPWNFAASAVAGAAQGLGDVASGAGTVARGAADIAGGVAQRVAPALQATQGLAPNTPRRPAPAAPPPAYTGSPSPSAAPPSARDDWRTNPGTTPQPAQPPADPRLSERDSRGLPMYGTAGTFLPTPGLPHIPMVTYGADEGDGNGRQIEDYDLNKKIQEYAQAIHMHNLSRAEKEADNDLARATLAAQREQSQRNFEASQAATAERAQTAHDDRVATRTNLEYQRAASREQHAQTLVGPDDWKIPQGSAPGGILVDRIAGLAYARGADGQIIASYPIPRPAPKSEPVAGYGVQEETIDPTTRQLTYRPTGQYRQQFVGNTLFSESPQGFRPVSRTEEDPQVTRWTDQWGREKSMNARTGERRIYNEGTPITQQRGHRTWTIPPPAEPWHTPPHYSPTTYGRPNVWDQPPPPLLPGVQRLPNGNYLVPNEYLGQPQEQPPVFVQPQLEPEPEPEQPMEMSGAYA